MTQAGLSRVGEIVRRHDPDRFFTALFAPATHRDTLFTLYAFNHELARANETTREPIAALIRLQWWREVVEGARRRHEVAGPLGEALDSGRLLPGDLLPLIEGRETEADGMADQACLVAYAEATAGRLMIAAARALGLDEPERLLQAGAACAVSAMLQNLETRAARRLLPEDGTSEAGLRTLALGWLSEPVRVPRAVLAAALPVTFARSRLKRERGARARVLLAVLRGAA